MSLYPGVSVIMLAVADLGRSSSFYERLGWRRSRAASSSACVYFMLNTVVLGLRVGAADRAGPSVVLTQCHGGRGSLDAALARALAAGAVPAPCDAPAPAGGLLARFADPDGHVWELAYDPRLELGPDGTVTLPP